MNRFIATIKALYEVKEVRDRLFLTFTFLFVYRFASYIPLPGIDATELSNLENQTGQGLLSLLNAFTGGAFAQASVMALGIMPYISASIAVQILTMAVPYLQKLQKEGESGRKKITNITRILTIGITLVQAPTYIVNLKVTLPETAFLLGDSQFWITSVVVLVAGTVFTMWMGERITDKGIGNGISLLIMVGIIARFPVSFTQEFVSKFDSAGGGPVILLVEVLVWIVVIGVSIMLVRAVRRVPVQYVKRNAGGGRSNVSSAGRQYLPLKMNSSGVMPIIFAQAIMFLPATLFGFFDSESLQGFTQVLSDINGLWYNLIFGLMIVLFTYLYTAIAVSTKRMSEDMKKGGTFIPGIKPGVHTAEHIDSILSKILLPGAIFLAIIAVLPSIAFHSGINQSFALFYGGTSLLILVGVVLDTIDQIKSYMLNRRYDNLMKENRYKRNLG